MGKRLVEKIKTTLILCACFFAYGTLWADWSVDYYLLWVNRSELGSAVSRAVPNAVNYYANMYDAPSIHKAIPLINVFIATFGFGVALTDGDNSNILFDGASLVLMIFAISVQSGQVLKNPAIKIFAENPDALSAEEAAERLSEIAVAHLLVTILVTGIIFLQVAHFFVSRSAEGKEKKPKVIKAQSSKKEANKEQ